MEEIKSFNDIKLIHKFNNGNGAILCHGCNVIIATNTYKNDLYSSPFLCKKCINERKQYINTTWTSIFNKFGIKLKKPIKRKLIDLTDNHLFNIVNYYDRLGFFTPRPVVLEILFRKAFPDYRKPEKITILDKLIHFILNKIRKNK